MSGSVSTNEGTLELQPSGAGGVQVVENWLQLAQRQGSITLDRLQNARSGTYFAMEDRNTVSLPWRRIYLVRENDAYVIYDEDGWLLDEPTSGCKGGRDSVSEVLDYFGEKDGLYYRPPNFRRALVRHRDLPHTSTEQSPIAQRNESESQHGSYVHVQEDSVEQVEETVSEGAAEEVLLSEDVHVEQPVQPEAAVLDVRRAEALAEAAQLQLQTGPDHQGSSGIRALDFLELVSSPDAAVLLQNSAEAAGPDAHAEDVHDVESSADEEDESDEHEASSSSSSEEAAAPDARSSLSQLKDPNVDDGTEYFVGQRVLVMGVEPEFNGMVAATSETGDMLVASDDGHWYKLGVRDVRSRVYAATEAHILDDGCVAVRALSRDNASNAVTGMFMGVADEHIFGKQMNSYQAHYAWREEDDAASNSPEKMMTRSLSAGAIASATAKTFALGDIVMQTNRNGGSRATAVVVRVAYKPRIGNAQARRMLLLKEVWTGDDKEPPKEAPQLFPASWCNWERVPVDPNGPECKYADASTTNHHCVDEYDELQELEQVRA